MRKIIGLEIVEELCRAKRLTTAAIEARRFGSIERAQKILSDLDTMTRFIERSRMLVAEPLPIAGPLHAEGEPNYREVSAVALARIPPPKLVTVYYLTERGANFFGGNRHGIPSREQTGHDLGVARVFDWFLEHRPEEAAQWVGEDSAEKGQKTPDAIIASTGTWIEYVGAYPALRIAEFHVAAAERGVRYELY